MKKSVLAVTTLTVMVVSGMANAAFTDTDASGNWTGNLEFSGTITNTTPVWTYQIPDATVVAAKDWEVERQRGTVSGTNTSFSFAKNITVLEGVMKEPVPSARPGLQPVITFGNQGSEYRWDTSVKRGTGVTKLSVTAKASGNHVIGVTGQLQMTLSTEFAAQAEINLSGPKVDAWFTPASYNGSDAYALLKSQPYYDQLYNGIALIDDSTRANSSEILGKYDQGVTNASAALVVKATEFSLTFPTASIPNAWTATLPISITVN